MPKSLDLPYLPWQTRDITQKDRYMKAFVTGGSGFIGQRVVHKLVERGYEVLALARSPESASIVTGLGATAVPGDITDVASMEDSMQDCDVVFHLAAWYKLGAADWEIAETINVGGTRKVLRLANRLDIPKIVYVSTIAVFGDTHGELVDENYFNAGPFLTEYDRTKWLAHYKVALPLIEKGAPIIITMPGVVYGPGDDSTIAELMRLFYRGTPFWPAPESIVTFAHVDDIAEGIVLAAEKGRLGESYILAGPAIPNGEIVDFWAHLTGKPAPHIRIPASLIRPFAPFMDFVSRFTDLKGAFSRDGAAVAGATYMARADKARRELGWQTRPLQTGMLDTFEWIARTEDQRDTSLVRQREEQITRLALLMAGLLFLGWLFGRRRKKN